MQAALDGFARELGARGDLADRQLLEVPPQDDLPVLLGERLQCTDDIDPQVVDRDPGEHLPAIVVVQRLGAPDQQHTRQHAHPADHAEQPAAQGCRAAHGSNTSVDDDERFLHDIFQHRRGVALPARIAPDVGLQLQQQGVQRLRVPRLCRRQQVR